MVKAKRILILEIVGYESFHQHVTEGSLLDGWMNTQEAAERLVENNQKFFCISDHGMMSAIPSQLRMCDKFHLNPLFACELYLNPLQPNEKKKTEDYTKNMSPEEKEVFRKSYHLIAIASTQQGYKNLVQLSSWAWVNGFYRKPRINHDQLVKHKEGIIFSSACFNSEIGQTLNNKGKDAAFDLVQKYKDMLGSDNFYLELMLLDFNKQKDYDSFLIEAADKYGLKLSISCDSHYANPEDAHFQQLMLLVQTQKTLADIQRAKDENEDLFELQDANLWIKSEEELNQKWESDYSGVVPFDIFQEAKRNTVRICEQAKGVQLDRSLKLPIIPDANQKLLDYIKIGLKKRNYNLTKEAKDRITEEYELIIQKEFASYFLIQKMMVDEARRVSPKLLGFGDGSEAVGPGRGSAAGSLVLYLLGVTDVDPIKHELLFSRFLSPARGGKTMKLRFSEKK